MVRIKAMENRGLIGPHHAPVRNCQGALPPLNIPLNEPGLLLEGFGFGVEGLGLSIEDLGLMV